MKIKTRLDVYEQLRTAHRIIKDIYYLDEFDEWDGRDQDAIQAIHSVLYLAEGRFAEDCNDLIP